MGGFGVADAGVVEDAAAVAPVAAGVAGVAAAGGFGGDRRSATSALIISGESRRISQMAGGAPGATPTSVVILVKPSISMVSVQLPSARSGNEYTPCSSVVVTCFWSPIVAVTVAPGTGSPPDMTWPRCSEAISPVTAIQAIRRRPKKLQIWFWAIWILKGRRPAAYECYRMLRLFRRGPSSSEKLELSEMKAGINPEGIRRSPCKLRRYSHGHATFPRFRPATLPPHGRPGAMKWHTGYS